MLGDKELVIAWRLFKRELLQGQLLLIIIAISLAVLSVTGLARISERAQLAINGEASKYIASDRAINSPIPIKDSIFEKAAELNIAVTKSLQFNSMVYAGEQFQLVTVRAVDKHYPLKGEIPLRHSSDARPLAHSLPHFLPRSGEIWYETRLANLLEHPEALELGMARFSLTQEIIQLPDAGFNLFASSPVVLMALEDVANTKVIQPGSRVTYIAQFAGDKVELDELEAFVKPLLTSSQRWLDARSGDTPIAGVIKRAEHFLLLASLFGIVLACVAIGIAAHRYCERHYDMVAMLKSFGASATQIRVIFFSHLSLVTLFGIGSGLIGGYLLDHIIILGLPAEMAAYDPPVFRPVMLGVITGVLSSFLFAAYPLLRLLTIPPLRVFQGEVESPKQGRWLYLLLNLLAISLLGYLYSGSLNLTLTVIATGLLLSVLLSLLSFLMLNLSSQIGMKTSNPIQLALAGLRRRAKQNSVQLVGFSSALMLLLTILALRQDLLNEWQSQLPEGTPNYFLVNIAPGDEIAVTELLAQQKVVATQTYPVIRGRLTEINGEKLIAKAQKEAGEIGRVGITRELNLTWTESLPANNQLIKGKFNQQSYDVSIEAGVAERLAIGIGDKLTYEINNQRLEVTVTSIRAVQWESLQPNFYMIFTKEALTDFAYTSMVSFHLPASQQELILELIQSYPSVSIIDIGAIIEQLTGIIDQVSIALALVVIFVVLASSLVMIAQTEAGMASRQRELAVLRTFGASGRLLKLATALEFAILGLIAGVLAAAVAEFSLYLLKTQIFELQVYIHWDWWFIAPLGGAAILALLGTWCCRQLLAKNCRELLSH